MSIRTSLLWIVTLASFVACAADFSRTYSGKIDGKYAITMQLNCTGVALSGTYSYDSKKIPIRISGSVDWNATGDQGDITLLEFNEKGMVTGFFRGVLKGAEVSGSWSTPDGARVMPFRVQTSAGVASAQAKPAAATNVSRTATPTQPLTVKCSEKETASADSDMPVTESTCLFRDFKAHAVGTPDYKGRYSHVYTLYRREGQGWVQVSNATLFQAERLNELEKIINQRIRTDVASMRPDAQECFSGFKLEDYLVNQLGIYFRDDQMFFSVSFGLSAACMAVDGTVVSFTLKEIQPYLSQP